MPENLKKAKITAVHLEEAAALSELWATKEHPSQAVFGQIYGIGNQSAVGQFLRGVIPLSLKAAQGFARGLGCQISDFSPRLANMAGGIAALAQGDNSPLAYLQQPITLEQALQTIAQHLIPVDQSTRNTSAALLESLARDPESVGGVQIALSALLHQKAALLPMSTGEALKSPTQEH
jgi:hypothetical protein